MTDSDVSKGRRQFFTRASAIPISIVALNHVPAVARSDNEGGTTDGNAAAAEAPYTPAYFTDTELAFLEAACDRLIPSDDLGPGAVEAGVLEFLDRHMQTPYAAGAIWYMQGPFIESKPEFGYQGKLALKDIMRVGIAEFDNYCRKHEGNLFKDLPHDKQEALLKQAQDGKLEFESLSSKLFFSTLLDETKYGFFADPRHGGNKNMVGWKLIEYPGMRADYMDWVSVRDKPYPLPPVNLAGERG